MPFVEHSRKEQDLFWIISEPSLTQPSLLAAPSPPQTPHFPPDSDLLLKAARTYHRFLTWPVPYCSICQELLTFIDAELKAPGKCGGSPHVGQGPHGQEVPKLGFGHGPSCPPSLSSPLPSTCFTASESPLHGAGCITVHQSSGDNSRRNSRVTWARVQDKEAPPVPLLWLAKGSPSLRRSDREAPAVQTGDPCSLYPRRK